MLVLIPRVLALAIEGGAEICKLVLAVGGRELEAAAQLVVEAAHAAHCVTVGARDDLCALSVQQLQLLRELPVALGFVGLHGVYDGTRGAQGRRCRLSGLAGNSRGERTTSSALVVCAWLVWERN